MNKLIQNLENQKRLQYLMKATLIVDLEENPNDEKLLLELGKIEFSISKKEKEIIRKTQNLIE